jgi:diguanylate cyclase (GGDEF)-like protein
MVASAALEGGPFSVLAIDGDGLKQMNDRYGHAAGDAALLRLGGLIIETLRASDVIGRVGGDEFLALLPRTSGAEALLIAERLRRALLPSEPAHLTLAASVGIGQWSVGATVGELLLAADAALYEEKRTREVAS